MLGAYKDPDEALKRAIAISEKAVSMDDSSGMLRARLGFLYMMNKEFDKGVAEAERAVALEPNSFFAANQLAIHTYWAGSPGDAIPYFKKALRLSPIPTWNGLHNLACAYRDSGQYDESIATFKKILERWPDQVLSYSQYAATLVMAGREEEARSAAAEVLRIDPKHSLEHVAKRLPWKDQQRIDRFVEAARKAGLK
jgi:adenylate cyclase